VTQCTSKTAAGTA